MAAQKPYLRTQDLHTITMAPDVLEKASLKLLQRMHLAGGGGGIEGHNQEPGILRGIRQEIDAGRYERIRELSPRSTKEELTRNYTWRSTTTGRRAALNQQERKYPAPPMPESSDPLEEEGKAFDPRGQVLLDKTKERAAKLAAEKQQALAEASAKL